MNEDDWQEIASELRKELEVSDSDTESSDNESSSDSSSSSSSDYTSDSESDSDLDTPMNINDKATPKPITDLRIPPEDRDSYSDSDIYMEAMEEIKEEAQIANDRWKYSRDPDAWTTLDEC